MQNLKVIITKINFRQTTQVNSRWTFLARTTPNIGNLLQPLEEAIRLKFLPALTGKAAFSDDLRDLLALPVCLGGLGVTDPTCLSDFHHTSSKNVSAPLVSLILEQSTGLSHQLHRVAEKVKMYCSQYQETTRKESCHRSVQQTIYQYAESTGGLEGERCMKLAISPTHCRTRFCTTQGCFQRRSMPKVWMATTTLVGKLCVWKTPRQ